MNHKWNEFDRCEYCGIIKSSINANAECISKDGYDDGLVSAAAMATFTSLFESVETNSDDFNAGGGDFGGGGANGDY